MEEVHRYRGHTIRFGVQRSPTTLYWRARGTIEYTEGVMFWDRPGTRYIAKDGTKTEIISQAAKFYSFADAEEFAKQMDIKLTELTYIGQDDFIDSDQ
jgi:hypothetical protein